MLEIFQYDFMQKAFITGILIAIITPCIGVVVVLKRLSMIGDSLSHNSLAGVAAGLAFGLNPILGAVVFSIAAAFGIEQVRKSFPRYSEIAITVITSTGVGLAGVPIKSINFIFTLLTAVTISISERTVGTLVISSLLVLPVATAMQIAKSYKQTVIFAVIFAVLSTLTGLYISYYADFKPGGTIVLIGVLILIFILLYKNVLSKIIFKRAMKASK